MTNIICNECETVAHCMKNGCVPKTTKKDEALRLALEALEAVVWLSGATYTATERRKLVDDAINALREAMTEQTSGEATIAQQEPVAKVCHDLDGHIGWNPNLRQLPDEGNALYTSPPAQRTWVDLTDDEIKKEFHPLHATGLQFARAVLAKSKEKNA